MLRVDCDKSWFMERIVECFYSRGEDSCCARCGGFGKIILFRTYTLWAGRDRRKSRGGLRRRILSSSQRADEVRLDENIHRRSNWLKQLRPVSRLLRQICHQSRKSHGKAALSFLYLMIAIHWQALFVRDSNNCN